MNARPRPPSIDNLLARARVEHLERDPARVSAVERAAWNIDGIGSTAKLALVELASGRAWRWAAGHPTAAEMAVVLGQSSHTGEAALNRLAARGLGTWRRRRYGGDLFVVKDNHVILAGRSGGFWEAGAL